MLLVEPDFHGGLIIVNRYSEHMNGNNLRSPSGFSVILLSLCGLLISGCGYSLGYRTPSEVKTISVPMFNNLTFPMRREIEYDLTSAVRKEIQTRTPLALVDSENSDMTLYGSVRDFRQRLLAEGRVLNQPIEQTIIIRVDIRIEDYVNQRVWKETVTVQEPVSLQVGETIADGRNRAVGNLSEKIVELLGAWEAGT